MKKNIWYIDRDERIAEVVTKEFPKIAKEFKTVVITNPLIIDEKLKEGLPDVIFIDSAIAQEDDGIILRDFRMNKDLERTPIVMLGSDVRLDDEAQKFKTDALKKPFDMKQLFDKAEDVLRLKKK